MKYEYVKIDDNGNVAQPMDLILVDEREVPNGYVKTWGYQSEQTWWKPIYDHENKKWIESMSQEEINQVMNQPVPLSLDLQNQKNLADLTYALMMGEV